MSHDTVDDLHHAEDTLGTLRLALEAVQAYVKDNPEILPAALVEQIDQAVSVGQGYCRCEYDEDDGWLCDGQFCGCPAEHEHPGHA